MPKSPRMQVYDSVMSGRSAKSRRKFLKSQKKDPNAKKEKKSIQDMLGDEKISHRRLIKHIHD